MSRQIEINIEKLVLTGFSSRDRHRIGEAVRIELTRLLTEKGYPKQLSNGVEVPSLGCSSINVAENGNARTTGNQIAQSIFGGLNK